MKRSTWMPQRLFGLCISLASCSPEAEPTPQSPRGSSHFPIPTDVVTEDESSTPNPWLTGFAGSQATQAGAPAGSHDEAASWQGQAPQPGAIPEERENTPGESALPRLLLQSYREGTGSEKMVSLSNAGPPASASCVLEIYSNGSARASRTISLPQTWAAGQLYTLCTETDPLSPCDLTWAGSLFNGNDALVVSCLDKDGIGVVQDSLGQVGVDPGVAWTSSFAPEWTTQNVTLLRCSQTPDQNPDDAFDPLESWVPVQQGEQSSTALARCPLDGAGGGPSLP